MMFICTDIQERQPSFSSTLSKVEKCIFFIMPSSAALLMLKLERTHARSIPIFELLMELKNGISNVPTGTLKWLPNETWRM